MPSQESLVLFRHPSRRVGRRALRDFLRELSRRAGGGRAVTCLITTDRELRRLNRVFRGRNYATDVLSFPASGTGAAGDIAISFDRAAQQAAERGHSVEQEIRILMVHGVLHLAGMDHESDSGQMAHAEARWRRRLGLPPGLTERARA